ncbi:MAG TPA: NAD-dependent epimerase/dehydratase family protein [Chthoniobacter sp.]|nr:NAD-dependent epimerase/dehydratase family protein [Chthoniobacter sp.]
MSQRTVVTGASGHIGYHVASCLLEQGHAVTLLIRRRNRNIEQLEKRGAVVQIVDLQKPATYEESMRGADALFHLAAENTTDTSDENRVIENTLGLTRKVLDTAIAQQVRTIIYTSSVVVLGRSADPQRLIREEDKAEYLESPYVKGKALAEEYCEQLIREKQVDLRRLYPSWVVGPGDPKLTPPHKVIQDYCQKGQKFDFAGGISLAAVEEVARAHVSAWTQGEPGGKYVLGGNNVTFADFYATLARCTGRKPPAITIPKGVIYAGSLVAKLLLGSKSPIDPKYVQSVIGNYSWYDSAKAIRELGYQIPKLEVILSQAIAGTKRKALGTDALVRKEHLVLSRTAYEDDDLLLITGFPGWLGNRMLDILMNGDRFGRNAVTRRIRVLVQPGFKDIVSVPEGIEVAYGDITDRESLRKAMVGVKAVYHLAGVIYPPDISIFNKVNFEGTKNVVDAAIEQGTRRIIFIGTDSICGYGRSQRIFDEQTPARPYKNYGQSKYLAEKYVLDKTAEGKIDGTSLRGFWFFGPFMPERNRGFFHMFHWPRQIVFGNGKNLRSISHVDNTVQAFVKAEKRTETIGKWYWIGDKGPPCTVDQIYQHVADGLQVEYRPLHIPNFMCELFALADSLLGLTGKLNATIHAAGKFHKDIAGDISAAERDFDYRPDVGFKEIKAELGELMRK